MNCVRGFAGQGQYATLLSVPSAFQNKAPFSSAKADKFIGLALLPPHSFRSGYGLTA